jgi:WD40 repeat protein
MKLLEILPNELLLLIFQYNSIKDIYQFHYAITNHQFRLQWNDLFRCLIAPQYSPEIQTTISTVFHYPIIVIQGRKFVILSSQQYLTVWDSVNRAEMKLKGHTDRIHTVLQLDDERVITCSSDSTKVWNCLSGNLEGTFDHRDHPVLGVTIMNDRQRIATHSRDLQISIWNIHTGTREKTFTEYSVAIRSILHLSSGHLAVCFFNQPLHLLNLETGKCEKLFDLPTTKKMLQVSPNELLFWKAPGPVLSLDLQTGKYQIFDDRYVTQWLAITPFHPKYQLVTADNFGMIKTWNLSTNSCYKAFYHGGSSEIRAPVNYLFQLKNGRLLSGGSRGITKIWNLDKGECERILSITMGIVTELIDGRLAVAVIREKDNYFEIWNPVEFSNCS